MADKERVLVLGSSFGGGDVPPLVAMSLGLLQRGRDVLIIGDQQLAEITRSTGLIIFSVPSELELQHYQRRYAQSLAPSSDEPRPKAFQFDWADDVHPIITNTIDTFEPHAIICTGLTLPLAILVRADTNIPICYLNSFFYFGRDSRRTMEQDFAVRDPPMIQPLLHFWDAVDLTIHGTDIYFDPPPPSKPDSHHWVGPLMWEPPLPTPKFLVESGDPWALVSLSLMHQPGEENLAEAAIHALGGKPVRTLLTLGNREEAHQFNSIPSNVYIESYVPHSAVLPNASLSLNHGGHGIVSKSMYYGVPMVIVPMGRDQPGVAARAEALGIARVIQRNDLSEDAIRAAVTDVLEDPVYAKNAEAHRVRLQAQDSVATACKLLDEL